MMSELKIEMPSPFEILGSELSDAEKMRHYAILCISVYRKEMLKELEAFFEDTYKGARLHGDRMSGMCDGIDISTSIVEDAYLSFTGE